MTTPGSAVGEHTHLAGRMSARRIDAPGDGEPLISKLVEFVFTFDGSAIE